jgi:hypothetical protein
MEHLQETVVALLIGDIRITSRRYLAATATSGPECNCENQYVKVRKQQMVR